MRTTDTNLWKKEGGGGKSKFEAVAQGPSHLAGAQRHAKINIPRLFGCILHIPPQLKSVWASGPTVAQIIFKALHYFTNQSFSHSFSLSHPGLSIDLISVQRETVRLRSYMISIMYAGASFGNLHHVGFLYWPAVRWTPKEPVV